MWRVAFNTIARLKRNAFYRQHLELKEEIIVQYDDQMFGGLIFDDLMSKLPERYSDVIDLHYRAGVSFRDIAKMRGLSYTTIKNYHHDALERLRKICEERHDGR